MTGREIVGDIIVECVCFYCFAWLGLAWVFFIFNGSRRSVETLAPYCGLPAIFADGLTLKQTFRVVFIIFMVKTCLQWVYLFRHLC